MSDFNQHYLVSQNKGALLDTNLLAALLIGTLGEGEVEKFKRTRQFTTDDVAGMDELIGGFGWTCTTPHVIAEVSNLLDWVDAGKRLRVKDVLARYVQNVREFSIASSELVVSPVYFKLGITDAALFSIAKDKELVLITVDLPLYHYAAGLGVDVINFNHLRDQWLR